jgi:probable DNA repair protein
MLGTWELASDATPGRQPPSAWARTFSRLLRAFGWTGGAELVARAWDRVLSLFSSLDISTGSIDAGRALELLSRIAGRSSAEGEGRGEPVQILNLSEASGIEFDHLWIAGLDDVEWPRPAAPNPFLPIALQRDYDLPQSTPARELTRSRTITNQLLAAAPDIVVSYAEGKAERKRLASPLVAHLRRRPSPAKVKFVESMPLETFSETSAPGLPEGSRHGGGTRTLQLQACCPFRAFAEVRLLARPLEEPELGIGAREKGRVLHAALESLLREFPGSEQLRACPDAVLAARVDRSVASALRDTRGSIGTPFEERLGDIERRRVTRLLTEWITLEKSRPGEFLVAALETEREVEIGGLRLRTRVDRVDRVAAGMVLMDYKSGEPSLRSWEGERPDEPQLPLYAVTRSADVAAVAFVQVRTGAVRYKGYGSSNEVLPGLRSRPIPGLVEEWREVLAKLAEDFRRGHALADPKTPAECGRCHLHSLCRIADRPREVLE